jgi:hypothetical protein
MSDLDKRRLSIQLVELQGEQLAALLNLLQAELPSPAGGPDGEIELDLDTLPAPTLHKMQAFVNGLATGRSAAPPAAAHGGVGGAQAGAPHKSVPPASAAATPAAMPQQQRQQETPGGDVVGGQQQQQQQQGMALPAQPSMGPGDTDNTGMAGSSGESCERYSHNTILPWHPFPLADS